MRLNEAIRSSLKSGKAIIGYRRSIKFLKRSPASISRVIIAKNIPDEMRRGIEHSARIAKREVITFDGSSKKLGVICGKSFPITALVIKR